MLDWTKRPQRVKTDLGARLIWHAKGTDYYVKTSVIPGLPRRSLAIIDDTCGGRVIGEHRTTSAAMKTCERHARQHQLQEA